MSNAAKPRPRFSPAFRAALLAVNALPLGVTGAAVNPTAAGTDTVSKKTLRALKAAAERLH